MSTSFEPDEGAAVSVEAALPYASESVNEAPAENEPGSKKLIMGGMLQPFKVRNFSLLFGGQTISTIGDALYAVALPWLILNNGGNAQELGIVLTAYGIPRVGCVLLGGWLSDRLRPRRLMLIADAVRALLVGLLTVLALRGHPALWQLCAIAVPLGAFQGVFLPASAAILPDILKDEDLQAGNALSLSSTQSATLVGSAIAGAIVAALTSGVAFAIDALTFVASALSLALMRVTKGMTGDQPQGITNADAPALEANQETLISFGRFMRSSRLMYVVLATSTAGNFCFGGLMEVALPTLVHGPMHGGAGGYGLILAAFGAGALAGGLFAGMLGKIKRKGLIALLVTLIMAIAVALMPYGGVAVAAFWMLIAGIMNSISNVLFMTVMQLIIPRHLMGRVMGVLMFASFGTYPISVALAGVLTNQFGPTLLFPFSGLMLGLAILFGITQRELREL